MQQLKLANDLFDDLISGRKLATVRAGKRDIKTGALLFEATDPNVKGQFLHYPVTVTEVRHKTLAELNDEEAKLDGAQNAEELKQAIRRFYPDLKDSDEITVVLYSKSQNQTQCDQSSCWCK